MTRNQATSMNTSGALVKRGRATARRYEPFSHLVERLCSLVSMQLGAVDAGEANRTDVMAPLP